MELAGDTLLTSLSVSFLFCIPHRDFFCFFFCSTVPTRFTCLPDLVHDLFADAACAIVCTYFHMLLCLKFGVLFFSIISFFFLVVVAFFFFFSCVVSTGWGPYAPVLVELSDIRYLVWKGEGNTCPAVPAF
ncbi:T. brucei spp.-specific protein [Trypanosoma brucei gambiense DAL972]|uniref:T. brucei spp.-specific protein n=1 Tax=Trypanosoma brucei gambiense (strain MHOM/CI/86/DAL972) TaxID=679716 RepID=D0A5M0_TRYB9|nr:T. brucei spp.-specific protein [Trypanosoma brucei gambiense DAL972]CBH16971.1 T. brucei spp.-specific protein [Trypanosoma brucei gambiense DAL972]|eukprot:XP_011779235.1 T. brucei spp.-specific protein [Trypanosoma brucei gambiense DAL972]